MPPLFRGSNPARGSNDTPGTLTRASHVTEMSFKNQPRFKAGVGFIILSVILGSFLFFSVQSIEQVQGQFLPSTLQLTCSTNGDLFIRDSAISIHSENYPTVRVNIRMEFQSKGLDPSADWIIAYSPITPPEEETFNASDALVEIFGFYVTWENQTYTHYTFPAPVSGSVHYTSFGVGGSWAGENGIRASVTYRIDLTDFVKQAQQIYVESFELPITSKDLTVIGAINLPLDVQGGVAKEGESFFCDLTFDGNINGTVTSLEMWIPEEADITFNSDNLDRIRPNVLISIFSLAPQQYFRYRAYVQFAIIP